MTLRDDQDPFDRIYQWIVDNAVGLIILALFLIILVILLSI